MEHNEIQTYDKGVPLSGKDLDIIDEQWLVINTVHLDDAKLVAIDREDKVGVTRN